MKIMNRLDKFINSQLVKYRAKKRIKQFSQLNERELLIFNIVKEAIHNSSAILLIAPISGAKIIKLAEKEIFIILDGPNIIISNHKFHYNMDISETLENALSARFAKKMEHLHFLMKKSMTSGLLDGLHDISKRIEELNKPQINESNIN